MNVLEIAATLRAFVQNRFSVPEDDPEFTDDVNLFSYGYVDSFGALDLYAFVEKEFAVQFTESDLVAAPLNTIREMSTFIASRNRKDF